MTENGGAGGIGNDAMADWRPVSELFEQIQQRVEAHGRRADVGPLSLPEILTGPLALRLGRALAFYAGAEEKFIDDVMRIMGEIKGVSPNSEDAFAALYCDEDYDKAPAYTPNPSARRLPKPFEAVVETARRLRDCNEIRRVLLGLDIPTAAVMGGSVSYGRFYNVRGNVAETGASDLDLLVAIPQRLDLEQIGAALGTLPFFDEVEIDQLVRRAALFRQQVDEKVPALFSQKLRAWANADDGVYRAFEIDPSYRVSFHFADSDTFAAILIADSHTILDNAKATLIDYRPDSPSTGIARGFDGYHEEFQNRVTKADGGNLVNLRIYDTMRGRFKPGLHQQLIIPQFEVRWEAPLMQITLPVIQFKWKVLERLRVERRATPYRVQQLSLAHIRYDVFSPHVRRRTNSLELEF